MTCAASLLALVAPVTAQQVGYVDLTSPLQMTKTTQSGEDLPAGCKKLGGGFADGLVTPDDGKAREITLELTKLSSATLAMGSEFETEVRLMNTSSHLIQIPWSTDEATAKAGPAPDQALYEIGEFQVSLEDGSGSVVALTSLSTRLYSSKHATGTERKVAPGEWIVAKIKLKVEDRYHFAVEGLTEGQAKLTAEWSQWGRTWSLNRETCEVWRGTFPYYHYYDQHSRPAVVTIKKDIPPHSSAHDSGSKDRELK